MNIVHAEYNKYHHTIDINYYNGYILRIDCGKAEYCLITTPNSQRMLDALAIDEPLEYARLYLNSEMQYWINTTDVE
ncbi:MAG: toxin-antitoxin system protein [Clostridiales bacterium]|nr:toxin-antitoxin system protein [Clostridiales bacterium]